MKGLFWKYITLTTSLLLVSFGLFGAGFLWQTYNYTLSEKQVELQTDAARVAEMTALRVEYSNAVLDQMYLSGIKGITMDSEANIIVTDRDGALVFYADSTGLRQGADETISKAAIARVLEVGSYEGIGNFDGAFSNVYYTCGVPLKLSDGTMVGAVFVSSPASNAMDALRDLQRIFTLTALFVLFVGIIVSYFVAQSMARPLRHMSKAARALARGDFTVKVPEDRDDEIGELGHSFNHMSASLCKLEELRSSFVANVSHELKTPMTTIAGFIDGILDGTIPPERHVEYMRTISDEIHRLSRLVLRMLQASRIQSGQAQVSPSRVDICEVMRRVLLGFEQVITGKALRVDISFASEVIHVMADPDSIVQVIYNLIDNACKFAPEGGELRLSVGHAGGKAAVTVANTGPEIPPNVLPYIFDRFYKADQSRASEKNSAGLGLFIVKSIIGMHGEDITVKSENGVTVFRFTLPLVA